MSTHQVAASYFKAHCLKMIDEVQTKHTSILITKRGVPMAEIIPYSLQKEHSLFGWMQGTVQIKDSRILSTDEHWDADE
jgi:prevent-host-death family protein